ncbi:MAG: glycosyltransferase family 1 protein, partial [Planctomycetaceae bacterium]
MMSQDIRRVLVACPDARPPAYQAVIGLARTGLLHSFQTAYYHGGEGPLLTLGGRLAPESSARLRRLLGRRHHPEIPRADVRAAWSYDLAL